MKNNKVLSTLLMMTAMTSMVAGAFAVNKNVYRKADADVTSYKTIYLYVPNKVENYTDSETKITWDTNEDKVKINRPTNPGAGSQRDEVMTKIQDHLFFTTICNEDENFFFRTNVGGNSYRSNEDGFAFLYINIDTSASMIELKKYHVTGKTAEPNDAGTWTNPATVFNSGANADAKAAAYANAFITVLETSVCNGDSTDYTKLKSVWNGLGAVYSELNDDTKAKLLAADKEDNGDPLKDFAAKYDYIYWKYGSDPTFTKFINRSVTPRSSTYNPVVTDNSTTKNIVVVSSISLVSLSIVGLYFFLRKRKEDK